jgi:hypothetical protein
MAANASSSTIIVSGRPVEKNIYERLGDHKGIIKDLGIADMEHQA